MKPQFLLVAYDGTDPDALARRMAARPAHFERARQLKAEGSFLKGGAILNAEGQMIGSMMLLAFDSRAELDAWLETEPYVLGKVWEKIDIRPFRVAEV